MGNANARNPAKPPQLIAKARATVSDSDLNPAIDVEGEQSVDVEAEHSDDAVEVPDSSGFKESGRSLSTPPMTSVQTRKRSKRLETQSCQLLLQENQQLREAIAAEISLQKSIKAILHKREQKIIQLESQLANLSDEISH